MLNNVTMIKVRQCVAWPNRGRHFLNGELAKTASFPVFRHVTSLKRDCPAQDACSMGVVKEVRHLAISEARRHEYLP
jgi:hypothetical protein